MRRYLLTMTVVLAAIAATAQSYTKPAIPRDAALEAKIEKTLKRMTLDEKIGQMLELNLDVLHRHLAHHVEVQFQHLADFLVERHAL